MANDHGPRELHSGSATAQCEPRLPELLRSQVSSWDTTGAATGIEKDNTNKAWTSGRNNNGLLAF